MAVRTTQPVAAQTIHIAPVATVAPAAPMAFTGTQWSAIDRAVSQSLTGIQAGNTVGGFAAIFQRDLQADPGTNPNGSLFTGAQLNALSGAYEAAAGGGANFRDQGSSAAPFVSTWTSRLAGMFGVLPTPAATVAPIAVPPIAALSPVTAVPTIAPAPLLATKGSSAATSPAAAAAATIPADPVTSSTIAQAIIAALGSAAPTSTTTSALQTTTPGTSATTATAAGATDATSAETAQLLSALAGSSAGLVSPDSTVGVPSTAGLQDIAPVAAATTGTTSSNPALATIAVAVALVAIGVGGYAFWKHREKTGAAAPAAST